MLLLSYSICKIASVLILALTAGGRGEYNPLATNDTELGKQRNRRTQIIITPKLDQFMDLIGEAPETKAAK